MTEEQVIRHVHENKDARPDSIEFGTPSKSGVLKIYVNLLTMDDKEIRSIIDKGVAALFYARAGMPS